MNETTAPATCLRKKRFDTEGLAVSALYRMRARGQETERIHPYQCEHCKNWHLGRVHPSVREPLLRAFRDVTGERQDDAD